MSLWQWSTTPSNNASGVTNVDWAEGQPPSTVNDSARQMMADVAAWYASPEWVAYGDTPTYVSGTSFTVPGNLASRYSVGRRVRTTNTGGTLYGTITASAYTSLTTVTVSMDSGALDSGLSKVDVGIVMPGGSLLGSLINIQTFSVSGTYTPTPGATKAIVVGCGGGGAGGGIQSLNTTILHASPGGNAGSWGALWIASGLSSQSIVCGAGGAGNSGAAGGDGGQSSFGALMLLPGGKGGTDTSNGSIPSVPPSYGSSPSGSGIIVAQGLGSTATAGTPYCGGNGGNGIFGGGAPGAAIGNVSGSSIAGISAQGHGAGGGGGAALGSSSTPSSAVAGGNGSGGFFMIFEFAQ